MTTELERCLYCENCRKSMGRISDDELYEYWDFKDKPGLCFDCDPDSAAATPSLFWQWKPGDVFVLGDKSLEVVSGSGFPEFMIDVSYTREHAPARSCLSSSTYLNTFPNQIREGENKTVNDADFCPSCEGVFLYNMASGKCCLSCGYIKRMEEIILPSWVVSHPPKPIKRCPDCVAMQEANGRRGGARNWYCDYHYSLLDESYADWSLGLGNE